MEQHFRRFRENLSLRNLGPRTIKAYVEAVKRYFRFCRTRCINPDVTASARLYLFYLKSDLDRSPSTTNQIYCALKRYFVDGGVADWDVEAIPRQRRRRRLPVVLNRAQVVKLFEATQRLKYRVAFMTAYAGGLRRNEIRELRVEDIDSDSMRIFVRQGKGRKPRYVMLSDRLLGLLRLYWKCERPAVWLFPGDRRSNEPISGDALSRAFRISRDRAGLPKAATLHCLRHSFATHLLESQVPLPHIKELLGHSSLKSTMVYLKVQNVSKNVMSPLDALGLPNPALAGGV